MLLDVVQVQGPVRIDHREHQLAVVRERQELLEVEVGAAVDQKDAPRLDDAAPQQQPRELSFRGVGELRAQGRW